MPRKKKTSVRTSAKRSEISSLLPNPRSYMGVAYGALTVFILFVIIFLGLRAISQRGAGDISENGANTEVVRTYEVKEGDSLWTIAENFYKDGYKWEEIAKANNISNPDAIEKGMKLTIPEVKTTTISKAEESTPSAMESKEGKITGKTYTVVEGDNLWTIAVRAYGDGYKWTEIARVNNLANPDLIYVGDKFELPR